MDSFMSFDFTPAVIWIIIGMSFVSSVIQSSSGVGYAALYMMIIPAIISYSGALAVMYAGYLIIMAFTVISVWKKINLKKCWQIAWPALITNTIGIVIGTVVMKIIEAKSPEILLLILGIVLALVSLYFFIFSNHVKIVPSINKGLTLGGVGGLLAGFVGLGGPPIAIYVLNATDDANEYLGCLQMIYVAGASTGVIMHILEGSYTPQAMGAVAISVLPVMAGCLLGLFIARKTNGDLLKKIVYAVMLVMGVIMVIQNI